MRPGPGDVVRLRASGLSELFDDSLRWVAKHLDGLRTPSYGRSHLGSAVHLGTAIYDQARVHGNKPDVEQAVGAYLEYLRADENIHWVDLPKAQAERIGLHLVMEYCQNISPQFNWVAVEAECQSFHINMPNGMVFEITGTVDRVREQDGKHGIADLKTGYRAINADGTVDVAQHGPQLATYELLEMQAEESTGYRIELPAVVIGMSTSSSGEIRWEEVDSPRSMLFGDGDNMGYLIAASEIIASQIFIGNPRSMLCTDRYCPIFNNCFYRLGEQDNGL